MLFQRTIARRPGVAADHVNYKWWALSCTSLGMLLATINSGTLIIALPDLERSLHTTLLQLVWVILAYMMVAAVGLVIGPILGGALVAISWHWVFWFNVPLGLLGTVWGALVLRELAKQDEVRGLDLLGTTTFVLGLTGLVLGISRGGLSGWSDPIVIGSLAAATVMLPIFVLIERRGRAPMLDLSIFDNRLFAAATGAAFIN